MHVDGFRFDLAPALEPWDLGPDGYQLGRFPGGWAEWNGHYRDTVRRFWRGDSGQVGDFVSRISGSEDLYGADDRSPLASVNFVTAHDGFTLRDLVSYEHKRNEANGEENRDGTDANWSSGWGAEGGSDDETVRRRRLRMMCNLIATLAFSQGVPMLSHGDEIGRSQRGNNNAYCQDNEIGWLDWTLDAEALELLAFTRRVLRVRRENPVLRRRTFFAGGGRRSEKDVIWLRTDGAEMGVEDWRDGERRWLAMLVRGEANGEVDERGQSIRGDSLLIVFNAGGRALDFRLPPATGPGGWALSLSTDRSVTRRLRDAELRIGPRSLCLLIDHRSGS